MDPFKYPEDNIVFIDDDKLSTLSRNPSTDILSFLDNERKKKRRNVMGA